MSDNNNLNINFLLSALLKKIVVPTEFHNRVSAVREMLEDDVSGIVSTLSDFSVQSSDVDWSVETANNQFTKKLKNWLDNLNRDFNGRIPRGINALAQEYYKERLVSSFPILKIVEWKNFEGIKVPSKMFFVDGESVYSKAIDNDNITKKLIGYDYYLGREMKEKLEKGVIITNPYGRWYDEYPNPYLIKRGVYHNWKIIQSLKNKQTDILEQIIPYLLLIKKGFKGNTIDESKSYTNEELKAVVKQFQDLITDLKTVKAGDKSVKSPTRATNFDEELTHLIPDLEAIFKASLFTVAERSILSGMGFIDIAEAVSSSRRESILNPKAFIQEVKTGVKDFQNTILKELIYRIIEQNKSSHRKYVNSEIYIAHTPIAVFQTQEFKDSIRQLYDRGRISSQTAVELIAETSFGTEVMRREKEEKEGINKKMFPVVTKNQEGTGAVTNKEVKTEDKNEKELPDDKVDEIEKQEYDIGKKEIKTKKKSKKKNKRK